VLLTAFPTITVLCKHSPFSSPLPLVVLLLDSLLPSFSFFFPVLADKRSFPPPLFGESRHVQL
jgi:hypothetical protein